MSEPATNKDAVFYCPVCEKNVSRKILAIVPDAPESRTLELPCEICNTRVKVKLSRVGLGIMTTVFSEAGVGHAVVR